PKPKIINPKEVASVVPGGEAYVMYAQLSSDAGHPSETSLGRYHREWTEDGERVRGIDVAPEPDEKEVLDTMMLASLAMLGVCIGVRQALDSPFNLNPLADRYLALSKP